MPFPVSVFVYFRPFLVTISIQIEKSVDGVLGIQTRGRRMVGADETTELRQPPSALYPTALIALVKLRAKSQLYGQEPYHQFYKGICDRKLQL